MSKTVKDMIVRDYRARFEGVEGAVAVELRGLDAITTNRMRSHLRAKEVRVTVVKNALAKKAFAGGALEALAPSLKGPTAVIYGRGPSVVDVAREVVAWVKENDKKQERCHFKGAVLEGVYYDGPAGVDKLSKMPTREEAVAQVITIVLSPARKLVSAAVGPGRRVLGIVKEIESRLEKGETISARA
ncbi:MAG: 50S ribosomal protein L10 [Phycisphaeraceae bacterium]|nr:50S ribosomal protein L10 [Phycisphaeraceae bacterium]